MNGVGQARPPRLATLVGDIEAAIASQDRARQSELVMRSAAALVRCWSRLPPKDKPSFDHLLAGLLDQVDTEARATFARHLTPLRRAPRITTTRLACDPSPDVAAPILETCPSLDDAWLLQILPLAGPRHHASIARRPALGADVAEALVRGRHPVVVAALLSNARVTVRAEALGALVAEAMASLPLMLALAARADLPEAAHATLAEAARYQALQALAEEGEFNGEEAGDLLDHGVRTFRAPVSPDRLARYAASVVVAARHPGQKPAAPARIMDWLDRHGIEDALATLARDGDLPIESLIACHEAPSPHALALVVRGLGHPWPVLKALLYAAPEGARPERLGVAHRVHCEVGPRTARMVARYAAIQARTTAFVSTAAADDRLPVKTVS